MVLVDMAATNSGMDLNPLIRLKEALEGAQKNSQRMINKLDAFEVKLNDLEMKMQPIQLQTRQYTKAKENIAQTLLEVGKTYEYFQVANLVKDIVNKGITSSNQKEYLDAMIKLSSAKAFFESHTEIKSSTSALTNITQLLTTAESNCLKELERLLNAAKKSIEVTDNHTRFEVVSPLDHDQARDVKNICDAFDACKNHAYFKIYQQSRINYIKSTLKAVESEQSRFWNNLLNEENNVYTHNSHPFIVYYQYCYHLVRAEYQLFMTTFTNLSDNSVMGSYCNICEYVVNEIVRILANILSDDGLNKLVNGTGSNTNTSAGSKAVISNNVIRQSKLLLVRLDTLQIFNTLYEEFRDLCHPDPRRESSASIALYNERQAIVQASYISVEYLLSSAISEGFSSGQHHRGVTTHASSSSANASHSSNDVNSCDLHAVTNNILYCCRELLAHYHLPYKKMLELSNSSQQHPNIRNNNNGNNNNNMNSNIPAEVDEMIIALLENLLIAIETRAQKFDDQFQGKALKRNLNIKLSKLFAVEDKSAEDCVLSAAKHLFLVNNLHAILMFARDRTSALAANASAATATTANNSNGNPQRRGSNTENNNNSAGTSSNLLLSRYAMNKLKQLAEKVEMMLSNELRLFCESLAIALGLGIQDMNDFNVSYGSNKAAQHRLLKAKFSVFNTGLEALLAQQGEWRVTSPSLRETLSKQLAERISSTYQPFHTQYSTVRFSKKHMQEYIKHSPSSIDSQLKLFFGRE